ncbi:MAG: TIGR00375 family protein [Candidatus Nanohaloarchaea archaeon]
MEIDADFHIHGKHSAGVSPDMELDVLSEQGRKKGLDLIGTGDALNPKWLSHIEEGTDRKRDGIYTTGSMDFIITAEVEDNDGVHHLMIFPSLQSVKDVFHDIKKYSDDIRREGRPRIDRSGEKIAEIAKKHGCLIGPAHAFTPYTAVYGSHDSLEECYGSQTDRLDFLELGLSADTGLADRISDHHDMVLLSNSDAHSPWPHRLAREFNRIEVPEKSFNAVEKLFSGGRGEIVLNAGLDPREGKYHCSACNECHQKYSLEQAREFGWSCQECSGSIKKGVRDRIDELSDVESRPERPPYLHLPPLAKIIQEVVGHSSPTTKTVQERWEKMNQAHGPEIDILVEKEIRDLRKTDEEVAEAIMKFREEKTIMVPGGGGKYGELVIPEDEEEENDIREKRRKELECRY